jgi:hypothetical protein
LTVLRYPEWLRPPLRGWKLRLWCASFMTLTTFMIISETSGGSYVGKRVFWCIYLLFISLCVCWLARDAWLQRNGPTDT